jgi:hypothetical protein
MSQHRHLAYEIRVQAHLAPRRLRCFDSLSIVHYPNGETSLVGCFPDQAALFGLLNHLFRLGVKLLSVQRVRAVLTAERGDQACQWVPVSNVAR